MEESSQPQPSIQPEAGRAEIPLERRPLHRPAIPKPNAKDALTQIIAYLSSLQSDMEEEVGKADPPTAGQTILQAKRLPRTGVTTAEGFARPYAGEVAEEEGAQPPYPLRDIIQPDQFIDASTGEVWIPPGEEGSAQPGQEPGPAPFTPFTSEADQAASNPARRLLLIALAAVLLLGVWIYVLVQPLQLWRASQLAPPPAQPAATESEQAAGVSDAALKIAGLALDSIHQGDWAKAAGLFDQAQRDKMVLPGMRYQAALVALRQDNLDAANIWIDQSIAANESVADCLYLRARVQSAAGDHQEAAQSFEEAARDTPFTPRNYFFWAECLRRSGKPASAISVFEQALRRRPTASDAELIVFKMRLAKLETGIDTDLQEELASQVTQAQVGGNTLLLAAANAIDQRAYALAADYLRKAAQVMTPATLRIRERDFVFVSQARQAQIAPVLAAADAAEAAPAVDKKTLIDPATLDLEEADPANW